MNVFVSGSLAYDTLKVESVNRAIEVRTVECTGWKQDEINATISGRKNLTINVSLNPTNIIFYIADSTNPSISKFYYFSKKNTKQSDEGIELLEQYQLNGIVYLRCSTYKC